MYRIQFAMEQYGSEDSLTLDMLTLTIQHEKGDKLTSLLARLREGFRVFRRKSDYWSKTLGAVAQLEVKWNEENGWHPHIHAAVIRKGERFYPFDVLHADWEQATHGSKVIHLATIHPTMADLVEVIKYPMKFGEVPNDRFGEAFTALKGKRVFTSYGKLVGIPEDCMADDEESLTVTHLLRDWLVTRMVRHELPDGSTDYRLRRFKSI